MVYLFYLMVYIISLMSVGGRGWESDRKGMKEGGMKGGKERREGVKGGVETERSIK